MMRIARNWRVLAGGLAAGSAAVIGFAGSSASADPLIPGLPNPAPATVTVTVVPEAASAPIATAPIEQASVPAAPAELANGQLTATAPGAAAPSAAPPGAAPSAVSPAAPAPVAAPIVPATSGTIAEFLKEKGVAMEPQKASGFTALNIVLPMPTGWTVVPDPNVPDAFTVLADRQGGDGLYTSNAQLVVYKLVGQFDPREAISHGYVDSESLFNWQSTDASMAEFGGFPSSLIEGTYRENDLTLNTSRRHVIARSGTDAYLVSLSVTTAANQVVASSDATDAIVNGFRVSSPSVSPTALVSGAVGGR